MWELWAEASGACSPGWADAAPAGGSGAGWWFRSGLVPGPAVSAGACKLGGAQGGSGAETALAGAAPDGIDTAVAKLDSCAACLSRSCLWEARRSWATAMSSPTRASAPAERTLGSYLFGSVCGGMRSGSIRSPHGPITWIPLVAHSPCNTCV